MPMAFRSQWTEKALLMRTEGCNVRLRNGARPLTSVKQLAQIELVVQASLDRIHGDVAVQRWRQNNQGVVVSAAAKIRIEILDFGRPARIDRIFDATAGGPADIVDL